VSRVLFAAGGTGGHMFPAVAVAEQLKTLGHQVHFITDTRGARYLPEDFPKSAFNLSRLGSRTLLTLPIAAWQMVVLTLACFSYFIRSRPDRVIGFGGYVTYPVLLCSRLFRVPYFIHEQNSVMGLVNRWFTGRAHIVMTSFPITLHANENAVFIGLPVRKDLLNVRDKPYEEPTGEFRLLVLGGSQGASIFSNVIPSSMVLLSPEVRRQMVIVQQCRPEDLDHVKQQYNQLGIKARLAPFFDQMATELAQTHLVISRSGASTMGELTVAGRPGIFVPYPQAMDDHQTGNAAYAVSCGGGWLLPQKDLTPERLAELITSLHENPSRLSKAAVAIRALGKCNAAEDIARVVAS
jgi:UDP-N-acetylglucosamine--N-acetylmuramyl-(pentapeptide) pyrophosphoryl-undecaprenol N-acetylglucosamine transferase